MRYRRYMLPATVSCATLYTCLTVWMQSMLIIKSYQNRGYGRSLPDRVNNWKVITAPEASLSAVPDTLSSVREVISSPQYTSLFSLSTKQGYTTIRQIAEEEDGSSQIFYNYSLTITRHKLETLQAVLPPVLENYRNPCWYELVPSSFRYTPYHTDKNIAESQQIIESRCNNQDHHLKHTGDAHCWRLRCFPYFFLIGAAKSGTTDLYHLLKTFHPHMASESVKEPFYWGSDRLEYGGAEFAQYLDKFDYPSEVIRNNFKHVNGGRFHPIIVGDFSPNTYNGAPYWSEWTGNVNQSEPVITTPDLIYHIRPETKILFSMREPVARMISHFFYGPNKRNSSMQDLFTYSKRAIAEFYECTSAHSDRYCVYSYCNVLNRSMYYLFITDWLKLFSSQQIFVYRFEDYVEDRVEMVNLVSEFLKIGHIPSRYNKKILKCAVHNVNSNRAKMEPVPTAVLDMLTEFYRPWQNKMDELLEHDQRLWRHDRRLWHYNKTLS